MFFFFFFAFFPLKKSEQPEIAAFNKIVVNYIIYIFFNFIGAETRELVLTVVTEKYVMEKYVTEERMILVKVA